MNNNNRSDSSISLKYGSIHDKYLKSTALQEIPENRVPRYVQ